MHAPRPAPLPNAPRTARKSALPWAAARETSQAWHRSVHATSEVASLERRKRPSAQGASDSSHALIHPSAPHDRLAADQAGELLEAVEQPLPGQAGVLAAQPEHQLAM